MPEERNRIISDHLAGLCLCSTRTAVDNLANERAGAEVVLVGDVMADVSLAMLPVARRRSTKLDELGLEAGGYLLITVHRPGNVDDPQRLGKLIDLLVAIEQPAVFPVHPRTRARLEQAGLVERLEGHAPLFLTEPLGYLDFIALLASARAVLTDSGGVQKEAYLAEVPCITLRDSTEWVETVELGWNRLAQLDSASVLAALGSLSVPAEHPTLYGGGQAGTAVVEALERWQRDSTT
jgi:UDP-N-acetylglucosamine 2-epimerase (non-hydrolysing)/UDP-GlcNAc3NAcA epimerase